MLLLMVGSLLYLLGKHEFNERHASIVNASFRVQVSMFTISVITMVSLVSINNVALETTQLIGYIIIFIIFFLFVCYYFYLYELQNTFGKVLIFVITVTQFVLLIITMIKGVDFDYDSNDFFRYMVLTSAITSMLLLSIHIIPLWRIRKGKITVKKSLMEAKDFHKEFEKEPETEETKSKDKGIYASIYGSIPQEPTDTPKYSESFDYSSEEATEKKKIHAEISYRHRLPHIQLKNVTPAIQSIIPGHTITHKIGSGGFATVYQALNPAANPVAIKLPKFLDDTVDESILRQYRTEGEIWKSLEHDNVVRFFKGDTLPCPHLICELMEGGSLKAMIENHNITIGECADIMLQILDGISYAHRMGVIHRDIKPANILFSKDGIPKITDWGIGKFIASASTTRSGGTKGTLAYSSPEQISPKKYGKMDWSTDIYQAGVMFYEMLTGKNPFSSEDPATIVGNILHENPDPLTWANPDIPDELDSIVMKCLEKNKEDRWRSADVLYEKLNEIVELPGRVEKIKLNPKTQRAPRWKRQ